MHEDIKKVGEDLGINLDAIQAASSFTSKIISILKNGLRDKFTSVEGIDVIFFGSIAREEATRGSDRDYLIIINDTVGPKIPPAFIREVDALCDEIHLEESGRQNLFAQIVIGPELYIRIGLEADTNANITRRLLLMTESVSVYNETVHKNLLEKVIDRYCSDHEESNSADHNRVPRFLLNDLIRYWRTIAVDFGAKRWQALVPNSHIKYAKLRISRKVMFAGALASIFLTPKFAESGDIRKHLFDEFKKPSLARLAGIFNSLSENGKKSLGEILKNYNRFLQILNDRQETTKSFTMTDTEKETALIAEIQTLGLTTQNALEVIFFKDPLFKDLTREYGLF